MQSNGNWVVCRVCKKMHLVDQEILRKRSEYVLSWQISYSVVDWETEEIEGTDLVSAVS